MAGTSSSSNEADKERAGTSDDAREAKALDDRQPMQDAQPVRVSRQGVVGQGNDDPSSAPESGSP